MNTNAMIEFAKNNRTTEYFRDYVITQIRIAYRIMEYLAPAEIFQVNINEFTKTFILREQFEKAYEYIKEELEVGWKSTDTGSSMGNEGLQKQAIELMQYLLPIYHQNIKGAKEKRKAELIKELNELEKGTK